MPDRCFLDLQDATLAALREALVDDSAALQLLRRLLPSGCMARMLGGVGGGGGPLPLLRQPFWRSAVWACVEDGCRQVVERTRVALPRSWLLMGVPDEEGVLEEGQVFVHLSSGEEDEECVLEEGLVFVHLSSGGEDEEACWRRGRCFCT